MFTAQDHLAPDIARLRAHLRQHDWPYQELHEAALLDEACEQWPLLAQWAAHSEEVTHAR